jgi:hypothetical protein
MHSTRPGKGFDLDLRAIRRDSQSQPHDMTESSSSAATNRSLKASCPIGPTDVAKAPPRPITRFGQPFWHHLYGAPLPSGASRGQSRAAKALPSGSAGGGVAYRGALLLSVHIDPPSPNPSSIEEQSIRPLLPAPKPYRRATGKAGPSVPVGVRHVLQCAVHSAAGLKDLDVRGRGTRYSLAVSCGHASTHLGALVVARLATQGRCKPHVCWSTFRVIPFRRRLLCVPCNA